MRHLLPLVALLAGCSLINDPDWNDDRPDQGMVDMAVDGDTGPPDMGADMGPRREVCGNTEDDDGDGLIDCADFDCLDDPGCCGGGVELVDVTDWNGSEIGRTLRLPTADPPSIRTEDGRITRFDPDRTAAVMFPACLPLALGATVRADLYLQPSQDDFDCDSAGQCDGFVELVLAPARDIGVAGELLDELSVRVYPGLRVEVRRTGEVLESWQLLPAGDRIDVTIELAPSLDEAMVPVLQAAVSFEYGGMPYGYTTDAIRIGDLLTEPGCEEVPGLFLALQGQGTDAGAVGDVFAGTRSCPNPAQFAPPSDAEPLTRVELGWDDPVDGVFSEGGIESPTLVSEEDGDLFWHVMASGSNDQLELEEAEFRVGHAIGHASTNVWNEVPWRLSSEGVRYGDDPPSCVATPASCPSDPIGSVRDPFLLETGSGAVYAFARELVPFERPHAIVVDTALLSVSGDLEPMVVLTPAMVGGGTECESLRDPALIPTGDALFYWLFYTCEKSAGRATIRAVRLNVFGDIEALLDTDAEVLAPEDVQSFGAVAVRGAEPLVASGDDRDVIRVWFIGLDLDFEASIGVAIADVKDLATTETAPSLIPYPGNPVLQRTDRALECEDLDCEIHGFAVTDSPNETRVGLLRMLVARRVQVPGAGRFFDLFPLEQAWDPRP